LTLQIQPKYRNKTKN